MKTIQELYNEIMGSQELKAQFIEAAKAGKQEAFAECGRPSVPGRAGKRRRGKVQ